ncbi:MAG: proline hydroxylase [Alphaproteobacteria bacterium]|nr:proline hydroxylase [Alphaproteobacteria bacterium]
MKLSPAQIQEFGEKGYLFFPELFSAVEIAVLKSEVPGIFAQRRQENVREKTGDVVRTTFAAHTFNEAFRRLAHHPRLVEPAEQLLGSKIYIHQFKINGKAAFDGDVWQWHQDYGTWQADDDMPNPRAMNLAVFLDEVTEFNGPLWFIPGSHRDGRIEAGHDLTTTSYPLWTIDNATIAKLVRQGGIISPKGKPGAALFFHCNIVHGSPPNMSPYERVIVYISANSVENAIRRYKRPEWIAHRDFTPVMSLDDDCLKTYRRGQAAE